MNDFRRGLVASAATICGLALLVACSKGNGVTTPSQSQTPSPSTGASQPTYDVDAIGVPKIATSDYIDLSSIGRISKFRSSEGHDYHDDFESCRSMKHYFEPKASVEWASVRITSPVQGTVALTRDDFVGKQIVIQSFAFPAFTFILFHVNPSVSIANGTPYSSGQPLGTHIGTQTMSDIAVGVATPTGYKLVSWFDVMSDAVYQGYAARGIGARTSAIISRVSRDGDPLTCSGDTFTTQGTLANWLSLSGG